MCQSFRILNADLRKIQTLNYMNYLLSKPNPSTVTVEFFHKLYPHLVHRMPFYIYTRNIIIENLHQGIKKKQNKI